METSAELKNIVKEKYGEIARNAENRRGCGCECGCSGPGSDLKSIDYSDVSGYYPDADFGLGCGIPTEFAAIAEGDTVLDLGSGAGNDVFVARALVGDAGKVIGVDMTEAMVAKALSNQEKLGYTNVEFRYGEIEDLPVGTGEVDVVVSNCVLNLVPDKRRAFQEIFRVLKPGGHFCISDIVLLGELPDQLKSLAELYAGCIAGALQRQEYLQIIQEVGFVDVEVKKDHKYEAADETLQHYMREEDVAIYRKSNAGVYSITVYANKPLS